MKENELLPNGWIWEKIGNICDFTYGDSLPAKKRKSGMVPVYGSNGIVGYHDTPLTNGPTIIVGRKGSIGEINYSPQPCFPIDTTYYITPKVVFDNTWFVHWLRVLNLQKLNRAAAVPGLNRNDVYSIHIPLPPLDIQKKIALVLEKADQLRQQCRQAQDELNQLTQSIFLDMFGDPVTNPKGWEKTTVEELCLEIVDCPHSTPKYLEFETKYKCIRTSDIQNNGYFDWSTTKNVDETQFHERIKRLIPQYEDIVYSREGARFGFAGRIPENAKVCLGQRVMLFRVLENVCTSEFLWRLLNSKAIFQQAVNKVGGSASPHVNVGDIKKFKAFCPPYSLQQQFSKIIKNIDHSLEISQASLQDYDNLFNSLLQRAFKGELKFNDKAFEGLLKKTRSMADSSVRSPENSKAKSKVKQYELFDNTIF